ncbi:MULTISPECIES: ATP-binding cassette domain-containing protein [Tsukamurella]|uniref:ABC transporter ATP-binding protein n=2 Tax=Tsukamurella TaxID=2060 RepID=A0A5C5S748_9ACTN|nr:MULTISPECIES: ABC transporter ATP-binding protein [Tsukamurella]NMD55360.1 ABC transporter ATP-binding protein [Tsukamurella columbiensis]TWS30680.1 ABC transporter ATP-binding protein [Tsukamurella conjunctivitidis]
MTAPLTVTALTITGPDGRVLLDRLDLTVPAGSVTALVGESGSGKTLTGLAVLGLLPQSLTATGSIDLGGEQVIGRSEHALRELRGTRAALVFQEPQSALNPAQRIWRQILQVLRAHRRVGRAEGRRRAVELLTDVGIPDADDRADWYPHQLSGGQKQRVVIALALASEPALLIADEPTTALDVTVQAQILALLRDLRDRKGLAVLLISHNLGVVADLADSVTVVRRGETVEAAPVDELFAHPRAAYTRELLAAVPRLPAAAAPAPVPAATEPVARVEGLRVEFDGTTALDGVDLTVGRGEVVGLVGESGSGKTTLGRVLLGLQRADAGLVDVRATRLALIHQDPYASLDPRWDVGRIVVEPMHIAGERDNRILRERAADLIDAVRLPADVLRRRPAELSGGQRQRVAFARALASAPELLVADEPTSALDVSVQAGVLSLFRELHAEFGFAAVFVTHDLAVVGEIADRAVVLRRGRVVEEGPARGVLTAPRSDYTRDLVAAVPVPDPAVQRARREGDR